MFSETPLIIVSKPSMNPNNYYIESEKPEEYFELPEKWNPFLQVVSRSKLIPGYKRSGGALQMLLAIDKICRAENAAVIERYSKGERCVRLFRPSVHHYVKKILDNQPLRSTFASVAQLLGLHYLIDFLERSSEA